MKRKACELCLVNTPEPTANRAVYDDPAVGLLCQYHRERRIVRLEHELLAARARVAVYERELRLTKTNPPMRR